MLTIVKDDDGHSFIVPVDKLSEWDSYLDAVYSDRYPEVPEWVVEVYGMVVFPNYEII